MVPLDGSTTGLTSIILAACLAAEAASAEATETSCPFLTAQSNRSGKVNFTCNGATAVTQKSRSPAETFWPTRRYRRATIPSKGGMFLFFSRSSSSDFSTALALFRLSASRSTSYSSDSSLNCTCSSSSFGITCAAYNFSARPRSARKTLVSACQFFKFASIDRTLAAAASTSAEIWRSSSFARTCPLCARVPGWARIDTTKPSLNAATSTWFSTTTGPEATKTLSLGTLDGWAPASSCTGAAATTAVCLEPLQPLNPSTRIASPNTMQRLMASPRFTSQTIHQPNHDQIFDHSHMPGRRKKTSPTGLHAAKILLRPCIPARIRRPSFGTLTRAKKTFSSPCNWLLGLTTVTSPRNVRVGNPSSLTDAVSPGRR